FQKKRNQDNLGAMSRSGLLLIDTAHHESLFKAKIKLNERAVTVAKAGGFVPLQQATERASGGLAVGAFTTISGPARPLETSWPAPRIIVPESEAPAPAPAPAPVEKAAPDPLTVA